MRLSEAISGVVFGWISIIGGIFLVWTVICLLTGIRLGFGFSVVMSFLYIFGVIALKLSSSSKQNY